MDIQEQKTLGYKIFRTDKNRLLFLGATSISLYQVIELERIVCLKSDFFHFNMGKTILDSISRD